jgi:hypothetical protein
MGVRPRKKAAKIRPRRPAPPGRPTSPDILADLARRLARNPSALTACQLTRASLHHRYELPRVAAAAAHAELASDPEGALAILGASLSSADPLVALLAATALARIAPEDERLRALLRRRPSRSGVPGPTRACSSTAPRDSSTVAALAGTSTNTSARKFGPPYSAADRFEWSGGWSDAARALMPPTSWRVGRRAESRGPDLAS